MTAFSAWYDDVLPWMRGCGSALADWAVRQAAITFCEKSHAWHASITIIDGASPPAQATSYTITPPTGAEVIALLDVLYNDEPLDPASRLDVARTIGGDWADQEGEPKCYLSQYGTSIQMVPNPPIGDVESLTCLAAIRPTAAVSSIDDTIGARWKQDIATGARALLWSMPDKPWTNMERAMVEQGKFDEACAIAHVQAEKGRTLAAVRSRNYYYPHN